MKKGVVFSFAAAAALSLSAVYADSSAVNFSSVKNSILRYEKYDKTLDINGDGRVDVLDVMRGKAIVIYPEKYSLPVAPTAAPTVTPTVAPTAKPTAVPTVTPTVAPTAKPTAVPTVTPTVVPTPVPTAAPTPENKIYSFLSLGSAKADLSAGKLTVPLEMKATYMDIMNLGFNMEWDSEMFSLKKITPGNNIFGSWKFSSGHGVLNAVFTSGSSLGGGGNVINFEFDIIGKPEGSYSFGLNGITAGIDSEGTITALTGEKCPDEAAPYSVEFKNGTAVSVIYDNPASDYPVSKPVLSPDDVYRVMTALKAQYPEGMRWTNDNYYEWKGGIYSGGYGCVGFAFILSDEAFGKLPARLIKDYSVSDIRVGDILRMNNDTHSVVVLSIDESGAVIAEGNYNNSVHWGRKISSAELEKLTYIMTRYPE